MQDAHGDELVIPAGLISVPLALAHATGQYDTFAKAASAAGAPEGTRYADWCEVVVAECRRHLVPKVGLHLETSRPHVIHAYSNGKPDCVAAVVDDEDMVRVYDGRSMYLLSKGKLEDICKSASDENTIVTIAFEQVPADDLHSLLLSLRIC